MDRLEANYQRIFFILLKVRKLLVALITLNDIFYKSVGARQFL